MTVQEIRDRLDKFCQEGKGDWPVDVDTPPTIARLFPGIRQLQVYLTTRTISIEVEG